MAEYSKHWHGLVNDLFRGSGDPDMLAAVGNNGGKYGLFDYAHGYFAATELLLAAARQQGENVAIDTLVYPVCYNFRHSVELFIKYLIDELGKASPAGQSAFKFDHDLEHNWKTARTAIEGCSWLSIHAQEMAFVEKTIQEIMEIDANGQIFRYPDSKKNPQHLKEWSIISLEVVERRVKMLYAVLREWHFKIEGYLYP